MTFIKVDTMAALRTGRSKLMTAAQRFFIVIAFAFISIVSAAASRADVAPGYLIHGNDQLSVVVYGDQTLTQTVTVLPDGNIALPLVGAVHVGGLTPDQAAKNIAKSLQKYVRHPVVSVAVTQEGQLNVLVLGNVKTPGKYLLPPTSHVTDAIAAAGGIGPTNGAYPNARVGAPTGAPATVSLQKLLHDGDTTANVPLQEGSVVYIPAPQTINVEVIGAVDHPGEIQLNEGDRLTMAIAKAGNSSSAQSDLNRIHITRTLSDGKTTSFDIDLYKELKDGDINKDLVLQKNDVVYVPQAKKSIGQTIGSGAIYILGGLRSLFGL
ncbi:MAG: hypothetical protein DLM53_03175 [Candidatus Eremiobacter antarcticus]|nr:MAG: hypothetical protein DLM53_03175 [Candidatus Eremiobacter sp. RRmetagenome_bin22]